MHPVQFALHLLIYINVMHTYTHSLINKIERGIRITDACACSSTHVWLLVGADVKFIGWTNNRAKSHALSEYYLQNTDYIYYSKYLNYKHCPQLLILTPIIEKLNNQHIFRKCL